MLDLPPLAHASASLNPVPAIGRQAIQSLRRCLAQLL